jgi:hypothetical protein
MAVREMTVTRCWKAVKTYAKACGPFLNRHKFETQTGCCGALGAFAAWDKWTQTGVSVLLDVTAVCHCLLTIYLVRGGGFGRLAGQVAVVPGENAVQPV